MWFIYSIIAMVCWSGSDLFSKIGCRDNRDKYGHLKMVMAVGVVMGLHACYEIFVGGVEINMAVIWTYLPVSLLYIGSMAMGYVGLRYIELSISSPICNASGGLVAILSLITGGFALVSGLQLVAIGCVVLGVIGIAVVEAHEDEDLRKARQDVANYRYAKSWLALAMPLAYCLLDAAGTFADNVVIEKIGQMTASGEDSANVAYELTFLFAGVMCFIYTVLIKKQKLLPKMEAPKYVAACFETAGQFAYIFAVADEEHLMMSAPIISSYCVLSVIWSRIFLKEKLSKKHYIMIAIVAVGIGIMGFLDP